MILAELKGHQYNVTSAAKALHLERSHLYKKAEQLGIDLARRAQESKIQTQQPSKLHPYY